MIHIENICKSDAEFEKPLIVGEEDRPFTGVQIESGDYGASKVQDFPPWWGWTSKNILTK